MSTKHPLKSNTAAGLSRLSKVGGLLSSGWAASAAELTLRRIDPALRRFVASYSRRRPQLPLELRVQLAGSVQPSLQSALPDVFARWGPLATLDHLADLEQQ